MKNKTSRTGRLLDWGPNRCILMILIICCLGISHIECLSISVSASPSTISTSATYSVGFFPTVSIPASAKITIVFPSASYPTIPNGAITGCTASPFSVSSCIGSSSGYSVTLSLTGTSFSFVTLTIPGITNPSTTAGVSGYSGYLYDSSGNTLDSLASSGVLFTPSPKAFSAASISIASGFTNTVGATIDIVVSLTYSSTISAGSILIISFPKWDDSSLGASTPLSTLSSLIACTNNDSSAALTSSYTLGSGSNYDQLTITTLFSSAASSGSTNNIRIKNFINYPLLKTYSTSISVTTSDGNVLNSNSAVTFTPTVATTFSSASVAPSSTTVFIPNSYYLSVKLNTILCIGCYMRITLPTEVSNLNSTSSDILTSVTPSIPLNTPTIDKTGVSSSPKYFDLKSMVTSTGNYITRGQSFYVQINNLSNPPSVKTSGSFTVALYDSSGNMYEYQSTGLTVTATAGALTVGSSSAFSASSTGVSSLVDFSINLYAATAISSGSLGSVVVTFPSSFTLTTGTCTLTSLVGFFPSSCSISGQVVTVSNFPTDTIAAGDNIQFTIASKKIQLPTTTATSSTFLIQTQLSSYTVDSISTLTWNQTTAGVIGLPTPSTNAVTLGDYGTYKSTTYTFEIYPPGIVPQNSIITITFPSEITLPSSITCIQILSIGSTLSCSVSGSVLTISNGYSSAAQAFSGTLALKFSVASITNPRSLKPTSAFLFNILNSSGGLMYSVNNPQLTLTTPQTFASIAISSSTSINGKSSNYTWTLVTDAALQTGDFIKIAPPSLVSFSTSPVCTGITGLASSLSCTNNYGVLYIYVAFSRRNLASGSPGTYSFSVNSITNGPSTYPRAFTIQTSLSDQIYAIEQNSATTITNTVAGTIISASVKPNSYILGISTSYTVTFTPVNYIQGMGLTITVPSELVISDGTNTCTNLQNFADSTFSCVYTASTQTIVISGEFTSSSNPGQVSLTIPSILNPSSYKTTSSFKIDTYQTVSSVNYAIDSISSGLSVDVKCSTECLTCSVSASYCVTCDTNSSYKYFQSNSCVSTCSDGYYLSNSYTCSKCDSSCVKCSGTATNCIVYTKSTQTSLSMFAPFIFLIVCIITSIILLILRKCVLKHMRYVELEISIVSVIQTLCWIFYLIVLGVSGYFSSFGLVLASLFANIVFNIVTFILYKKFYSKDYEFRPFMHAHKFSKFIILGISLCLTHRFFHFTMSFCGIPFSAILRLSAKKFKIVNIVSLFFTDFIICIAAFVNLAMSSTNEQAFYSSLEVIILSIFILILLTVELIIWKNYKTMQKTSPNLLTEHVSMFDMISNVSKITDRDEVTMRKSVLKKIMKRFPLKNLRRSMFTLNDEDNTNNYKRRLSFQEPKNKFDPDSENIEEFDDREVESLPDLEKELKNMAMDKTKAKKFLLNLEGKTDLQSLRLKHKTLKYIQNLDEDEFEQDLSLIEEEKKLPESEHNSIEDEFYQFEEKYEYKDEPEHEIQTHGMGEATTYYEKASKTKVFRSNKSESSYDSKMEDTPSNYNILNGRIREQEKPVLVKFIPDSNDKNFGTSQINTNLLTKSKFKHRERNAQTQLPSALDTINRINIESEESTFKPLDYGRSLSSIKGARVADSNAPAYNQFIESIPAQMPAPMNQTFGLRSKSVAKLVPEAVLGSRESNIQKELDSNQPSAVLQKERKKSKIRKKKKLPKNKSANALPDPEQKPNLKYDKNLKTTNANDLASAYN